MSAETVDLARLGDTLETLRREVARLGERVAALEAAAGAKPEAAVPAPPPAAPVEPLSVAAFLGKKPHIRQIRLLGSAAWAQQGRLTIQASHALSSHHR
jgi:methylmalonyl-CoA carboxyltransferase large subunit